MPLKYTWAFGRSDIMHCSWISEVLLTQFSLHHVWQGPGKRRTPPQPPAFMQTNHSLWEWEVLCLRWWWGTPQWTAFPPFLLTLYSSDWCHLQKYRDGSAVVDCFSDRQEAEFRDLVDRFVKWCRKSCLILNTSKTKEIIVDFRRKWCKPSSISISGEVELVEE